MSLNNEPRPEEAAPMNCRQDESAPVSSADAATAQDDVLQLPPEQPFAAADNEVFEQADTACAQTFANIIYATQEREFWLLPQALSDQLKEASDLLENNLSAAQSPDEKARVLSEEGLLEYFLTPELASFLDDEKQARMREIEAQYPDIERQYTDATTSRYLSPFMHAWRQTDYATLQAHYREWQLLEQEALSLATEQGYTLENGQFFSQEAIEAREAVATYNEAVEALTARGELPADFQAELEQLLAERKRLYDEFIEQAINGDDSWGITYLRQSSRLKSQQQNINDYIDSILRCAQYGLALPEFALIGGDYTPITARDDLSRGISAMNAYLQLKVRQDAVRATLEQKHRQWLNATGENLAPPDALFAEEREQWRALAADRAALKHQAQDNVARMVPRRHLLWEPQTFSPQPEERLVKTQFPLREISFADGSSLLQHFSLHQLRDTLNEQAREHFRQIPGKAKLSISSSDPAQSARSILQEWLYSHGGKSIADQGDWFDEEGWFDVERFYATLAPDDVISLQNPAQRKRWGDRLRQVLFKQDLDSHLRLFNSRPQAQLIRCLTSPAKREHIHASVDSTGPWLSLDNGLSFSAHAALDINLALGEVELLEVDIPRREEARSIQLDYLDYQGQTKTLDFGRMTFYFSMRAWGYAGASMMLTSVMRLGPDKHTLTPQLDMTRAAERLRLDDGIKVSFNIFAGAQAGIKLTGALNWAPPAHLAALRRPFSGNDIELGMQLDSPWRLLAKLDANLAVAAGIGAKADWSLSWQHGQLIIHTKAAVICGPGVLGELAFVVGYEAIVDIINLVRRELRHNQYHRLDWIDQGAFQNISRLSLLGACGIDVGLIYTFSIYSADLIGNLYEAMTSGGKGGVIAHTLNARRHQSVLREWIIDAPPEALGPLLMTLLSEPRAFEIEVTIETPSGKEKSFESYTQTESHLLQQQAIELILRWILNNAQQAGTLPEAQRQFEEACTRMNRFGTRDSNPGQSYCENRFRMDKFMAERVMNIGMGGDTNNRMRQRYRTTVSILGQLKDSQCTVSSYIGKDYLPGQRSIYLGTHD